MLCAVAAYVMIPTSLKLKPSKCQKTSIEVLFDKKKSNNMKILHCKFKSIDSYLFAKLLFIYKQKRKRNC